MSCKIKTSTEDFLKSQGIISGRGTILDPSAFESYNETLTNLAYTKYGVGDGNTKLFSEGNNKAIGKDRLFELLDEQVEFNLTQKTFVTKKGVKDVIDNNGRNKMDFEKESQLEDERVNIYTDLDTLEKKFQYSMERIQESIKLNINELSYRAKRQKNEDIRAAQEGRIRALNELSDDIIASKDVNKASAITAFINNMMNAMMYIETKIDNLDYADTEKVVQTAKNFNDYLMTFSVIEDVQEVLSAASKDSVQKMFSKEEIKELRILLAQAKGKFDNQASEIIAIKKKALRTVLTDIKYFPKVVTNHRDRLAREWNQLGKPGEKDNFILTKITGRDAGLIKIDLDEAVTNLLENPMSDIYSSDVSFSAAVNVSSELIQIFNHMLTDVNNQRMSAEKVYDVKSLKLFEALRKEKGTSNILKLYKNIIEQDSDGNYLLKGEYKASFIKEVRQKIRDIFKETQEEIDKATTLAKFTSRDFGSASNEHINASRALLKVKEARDNRVDAIRSANLVMDKDGKILSPKAKWKNNFSNLSKAEKDMLDFFKETVDTGDKITFGHDSLKEYSYGTFFFHLPSITKTDTERLYQGDVKGIVTDKKAYFTKDRADDTEYSVKNFDLANNQLKQLRVHYRDYNNNFDPKTQSLDLSTIFRLEFKNMNMYDIRKKVEPELNFLLDIAQDKKFYEREGSRWYMSGRNKKLNVVSNTQSNTYNMMKNMMDMRFYDIMNKNNTKIGPVDANKVVKYLNGATSFVALSLNVASGTANVVNANAQMFLETFIKGDKFTAANLAKANKVYGADMPNILKDVTRGINTSYVNQIAELFNIAGLFNLSDSNFLQANLLKKGLSRASLQVFQNSGEHWIQNTLTLALLDNIQVMNKEHKYIDKNGKVVKSQKNAASILDMLKMNKETGIVEMSDLVSYTSHSQLTRWNEGGKTQVDMLVRKKIDDSIGNYTETMQADVFRHWLGKLGMLYRKYLVPMGQARFRGFEYSNIKKENLKDEQRTYSYALHEYEEGTYTTLIRYMSTMLQSSKTGLLAGHNYKNLSDYEKHNLKRATTEVILTSVILPLAITLLANLKGDDDDDNALFFLMYQLRRMDTELSAYRDPTEMFKMLKSPIPSTRLLETGLGIFSLLFDPTAEDRKGQNVLFKQINKFNPGRQLTKDYQKVFEYQNSNWGSY